MTHETTSEYIEEIQAADAYENLKSNGYAQWPSRTSENRVEPICQPDFTAPFHLVPGASVFTIGSCFARNVEKSLIKLGFDIPTHRALGAGNSTAVLNNYTAPSMLNEMSWALDETNPFDPDKHLYDIGSSKVVDLHLGGRWARPTDRATAIDRRARLSEAYKAVRQSRLLILTLGLAEAWYDTELGIYLNSAPLKSIINQYPGRFVVRVLTHAEVTKSLRKLVTLAQQENQYKDLKCVITVSPVPLSATFRKDTDVILANAYSKSTLRSAAEEITLSLPDVSYFPSFESITLSDRQEAWEDDMVHVRQPLIDLNVSRMISRYVSQDEKLVEDPDILAQLAQNQLNEGNPSKSLELADRVLSGHPEHERSIIVRVNALAKLGRRSEAIDFIVECFSEGDGIPLDFDLIPSEQRQILARMLYEERRLDEALPAIQSCISHSPKFMPSRILLGDTYLAMGKFLEAETAFKACLEISKRVGLPYYKLAQTEQAIGNPEKANTLIDIALTINPDNKQFKKLKLALEPS